MEVLASPAPLPPPASSPPVAYTPPRGRTHRKRPSRSHDALDSLLLASSSPLAHSLLHTAPAPARNARSAASLASAESFAASPSVGMSPALAQGVVRAPRRGSVAALPFVPMTPIVASPVASQDGAALADSMHLPDGALPDSATPDREAELGHGRSPPRWTSTPPTPPSRFSPPPQPPPARAASRGRRPVSVAVFPVSSPEGSPEPSRRLALPQARPTRAASGSRAEHPPDGERARRRMSLPASLTHLDVAVTFPARPRADLGAGVEPSLARSRARTMSPPRDWEGVLGEEAARGRVRARGGERQQSASATKKLFTLGDEDADAEEDEEQGRALVEQRALEERGERERRRTRRFHALRELLRTEAGYLADLQALVTVYLDQLPALAVTGSAPLPASPSASPAHSPLPSPSRSSPSALSLPGLAGLRPLPTSRSSFLYAPSAVPSSADLTAHVDEDAFNTNYPHPHPAAQLPERSASPLQRHSFSRKHKRPLLTHEDLQKVWRNADALLAFHARFVELLKDALTPLGFGGAFVEGAGEDAVAEGAMDSVDDAVDAVAQIFVSEAANFNIYEAFVPGQHEADKLLGSIRDNFPVEWDAYEQRCTLLLSPYPLSDPLADASAATPLSKRKRRHSIASVAALTSAASPELSERERRRQGSSSSSSAPFRLSKLRSQDYFVKPSQRICKYHLLLDQLSARKRRVGQDGPERDAPQLAADAMRRVVDLVNGANAQHESELRAAEVLRRIVFPHPHAAAFQAQDRQGRRATSPDPRVPFLTPEFVQSLGLCRFAGGLDVLHHPSALHGAGALRAKYLGVFLYDGGYAVMAKVTKSGKVYEPRIWLSLVGWEVHEEEDEDAPMPHSVHLWGHGHHLELAASCQQERQLWMNAIREALSVPPQWAHEPPSSMQSDEKSTHTSPTTEEGPSEWNSPLSTPLPTIQSLPEVEQGDAAVPEVAVQQSRSRMEARLSKAHRMDSMASIYKSEPPSLAASRRASGASVKAFFSSASEQHLRITRPTPQAREQVDKGLLDVADKACLDARALALMRDEELYTARRKTNMTRSNSGLSIGGMGLGRKKHDSVITSRRKTSLDGPVDLPLPTEGDPGKTLSTLVGRTKSMSIPKRRKKSTLPPSIVPSVPSSLAKVDSEHEMETPVTQSPSTLLDSPMVPSQCSSNTSSAVPSPVEESLPLPLTESQKNATLRQSDMLGSSGGSYKPKRTRSMVDNVRYFFNVRPESPTTSSSGHSSPAPPPKEEREAEPPPPPSAWWKPKNKPTKLRRRVQSSPDVPGDEQAPGAGRSSVDSTRSFRQKLLPDKSSSQPASPSSDAGSSSSPHKVSFNDNVPTRRRSLLVPSSRDTSSVSPGTPLRRSGTFRLLSFQRTNSFTPMDRDREREKDRETRS